VLSKQPYSEGVSERLRRQAEDLRDLRVEKVAADEEQRTREALFPPIRQARAGGSERHTSPGRSPSSANGGRGSPSSQGNRGIFTKAASDAVSAVPLSYRGYDDGDEDRVSQSHASEIERAKEWVEPPFSRYASGKDSRDGSGGQQPALGTSLSNDKADAVASPSNGAGVPASDRASSPAEVFYDEDEAARRQLFPGTTSFPSDSSIRDQGREASLLVNARVDAAIESARLDAIRVLRLSDRRIASASGEQQGIDESIGDEVRAPPPRPSATEGGGTSLLERLAEGSGGSSAVDSSRAVSPSDSTAVAGAGRGLEVSFVTGPVSRARPRANESNREQEQGQGSSLTQ